MFCVDLLTYKLVNKTTQNIDEVSFKLLSHNGEIKMVSTDTFQVPAQDLAEGTLFIEINNSALTGDKDKLKIGVYSDGELIETTVTQFLAPRSYN